MKFCTYKATPGLQRFPLMEQYHVWHAAHKGLMSTDIDYRRTVRKFEFSIYASVLLSLIVKLLFSFLERCAANDAIITVILILIQIAVILGTTYFILHASFWTQGFMNEEVSKLLQGKQP
jgi:hypothetical protein